MAHICVCKYPLIIVDTREGKTIEYIAMPREIVDGGDMPVPTIEPIETEGLDGIKRRFIAVQWQELTHDNVKEYDVAGHVVIAGCDPSSVSIVDGEWKCESKDIYLVLHPFDDWTIQHFIQLPCAGPMKSG